MDSLSLTSSGEVTDNVHSTASTGTKHLHKTERIDLPDRSCYLQDKRRLHPSDVGADHELAALSSTLAPCFAADPDSLTATCLNDIPVSCLKTIAGWH